MEDRPFDTLLLLGHGIGMTGDLQGLDTFLRRARRLLSYVGETRIQFEFAGARGPLFPWLHVDPRTLEAHAAEAGLGVEVLVEEETGE